MDVFYIIFFFILGAVLASFLTVVGLRLPKKEDFIKSRSHCDSCGETLKWYELIPIVSYIIQGGKCRYCKKNIGIRFLVYELLVAFAFSLSYIIFGFSDEFITSLFLISIVIVIIVSDIEYMIIPDEVLVVGSIIFLILNLIQFGFIRFGISIFSGILAFTIMYLLKCLGDFLFKKESLGGGDIKLMGMMGILFNYQAIISSIFLSSVIALPYALYVTVKKKDGIMPFGPFLSISLVIIFLAGLRWMDILDLIYKFI